MSSIREHYAVQMKGIFVLFRGRFVLGASTLEGLYGYMLPNGFMTLGLMIYNDKAFSRTA